MSQALAREFLQGPGQGAGDVQLHVTVGPHEEQGHLMELLGDVLEQKHR